MSGTVSGDRDLNFADRLLDIIHLYNCTAGEDIFKEVSCFLGVYDPSLSKLMCMTLEGAPTMWGKSNSFVSKLLAMQNEVSPDCNCHHIHCIIHKEVLFFRNHKNGAHYEILRINGQVDSFIGIELTTVLFHAQ